jgi:sn-glycerol 3-phosphate transport system ATP-binding protein
MTPLHFHSVKKSYGPVPVIHGLDLTIEAGEFVVILGPSGCGKSTLLRMVAGLESITSGEIMIDNNRVNEIEPRDRGCAMVFQNYALYPHMTVAENIGYALKVAGLSKAERSKKVGAVAATLGLADLLERKPLQLSGGQRQRVAMGRAMIREPKVFLYDEPLSNLDAKLRVTMRAEIRALHQKLGTTSLFVTHDQIEAMTLADRIVVMNAGKIEQIATPQDLYRDPASLFVADFVGAPAFNLISGHFDSATRNFVIDGGGHLSLHSQRFQSLKDGKAILGFRAESGTLLVRENALPFQLKFIEDLGAMRHVHGELGTQSVTITVNALNGVPAGTSSYLNVESEAVVIFDPVTTRRLV